MFTQKEKEFLYWIEHSRGKEWGIHLNELKKPLTEQRMFELMLLHNQGINISEDEIDK